MSSVAWHGDDPWAWIDELCGRAQGEAPSHRLSIILNLSVLQRFLESRWQSPCSARCGGRIVTSITHRVLRKPDLSTMKDMIPFSADLDTPEVTALRKPVFPEESMPSPRVGIALAVGTLAAFDQQVLRTMLQTLATRLSAYFRVTEAAEAEMSLIEHPGDPACFLLRVRDASTVTELRVPRPLRLMPLADALNASIDIVRPQNVPAPAKVSSGGSLLGLLCAGATTVPLRVEGAWGTAVFLPGRDEIAFDRSFLVVARALGEDARIARQDEIAPGVAVGLHEGARLHLRREEILWLCGASVEAQRAVAVKLAHPEAFLTLHVWPNLSRLPDHRRWLDVFATMRRGAGVAAVLARAAEEGITEMQARRGIYLLLQHGHARLSLQPAVSAAEVVSASAPPTSFMQRLKQRLRQLVDAA